MKESHVAIRGEPKHNDRFGRGTCPRRNVTGSKGGDELPSTSVVRLN